MHQEMIKLSIVVPTHRRPKAVFRLLESLGRQGLARDQFEILVVSNFPDKDLSWLLKKVNETQKNIRHLVAGAKGANASRNLGIKEGRGEVLLLLDDDCIVDDPSYLQTVLGLHREHPGALAIGGSYSIPDGCRLEDIAYNIISRDWQFSDMGAKGGSLRLLGGNVSYKRAQLESAGELFDPRISYGGAELEFHSRLAKGGALLLLVPELTVHHVPEIQSGNELVAKAYKQAMTTVQFSIQESLGERSARTYHSRRDAWALKHAGDGPELAKICELMVGYDRAYNLVAQERVFSLRHLKFRLLAGKAKKAMGLGG